MGPKGKGVKGKPSKQAKGRKKKEGEEEVEEENERAISPQPVMSVVDAEGMDTGSNREEEDEPDDENLKRNTSMMQLLNRNLLSFSPKTTAFTTKGRRRTRILNTRRGFWRSWPENSTPLVSNLAVNPSSIYPTHPYDNKPSYKTLPVMLLSIRPYTLQSNEAQLE